MKNLIILLSILTLFTCCRKEKTSINNAEIIDVHFTVTGEDRDVMKHIVFGTEYDLHSVDVTGNMDAIIPMPKGSYQNCVLYITSDKPFNNVIQIKSDNLNYYTRSNTCSLTEFGVKNQVIKI